MKKCSKCLIEKELSEFHNNKNSKDGKRSWCKECVKLYTSQNRIESTRKATKWREENRERVNELRRKRYKERYENDKEFVAKKNLYYKIYFKNRADITRKRRRERYLANIEKEKEYANQYRINNPEKTLAKIQRYKTKKAGNGGSFTAEQWAKCIEYFGYRDAYTGRKIKNFSVDHIIPISKGGTSYIWNIVPCSSNVNSSKQNKNMEEWYKSTSYFSEDRLNKIYEWIEYSKTL